MTYKGMAMLVIQCQTRQPTGMHAHTRTHTWDTGPVIGVKNMTTVQCCLTGQSSLLCLTLINTQETHTNIYVGTQQPSWVCPHHFTISTSELAPLSCSLTICLTCRSKVDKPQKVHQFEGAADHEEDAYSLQPLHLPLLLEEQMHPFSLPFPLFLSTEISF